ncbi:MAG: TonB-dependent receptor, partial [Novosphingobium sp.]
MLKSNQIVSLLALGWCMASAGASAQTSTPAMTSEPQAQDAGAIGEIIVTAQKREQRLNDVGISIVAATADQLQVAGVSDPTMLAKITPGFTYARTIHGYNVFSIRGVNFNASQLSAAPAVASYVDEAALPYASMTQAMLLDVDHVEILKGPQGTLFGQNATGGSVNAIAAKPTAELSAGAEATVNHFGQVAIDGFVSGPLSETLRARLAFSTTQFGAWQKGYYLSDRRIGDQNKGAARLLLDCTPTDRLKISVNVNGSYDKGEPQAQQLSAIAPQNPAGALPALLTYAPTPHSNRASDVNIIPRNNDYMVQGVLRADWDVSDDVTLTSITNGIKNRHKIHQDGDATALDIVDLPVLGRVKSFSQEFRLTGQAKDLGLNYILGANYQKDKFFEQQLPTFPGYSSLPLTSFNSFYRPTNRSFAIFGNADWEFVPGLTFTAGVRRTWTKQSTNGCTADTGDGTAAAFFQGISDIVRGAQGLAPVPGAFQPGQCATFDNSPSADGTLPFLPTRVDLSQKEKNVSWRAGLNYKPQRDILLYGLVSRGYKNGVFPVTDTIVSSQIRPVK